ncbi:NifU N-terminal domain-containing protein [Sporolactobacillus sp. CPB3-1]|uniref:NifU N-terminal domain-containing protein n=1 Tax=Sporolactobacillus mangiferae TaxID=2940498 RepID=A0ABT0M9V8_9BACL|nr:NifU N-terminal domain-containing protein [Sporolactobacillus mangiferae]MCL1631054.1 NifU N-terminal domain-containing protein [Sporolactobacillus mangiferae]
MRMKMQHTPNPNAMKFTAEHPIFSERVEIFKNSHTDSPLLKHLIELKGIDSLFGYKDFLTICKVPEAAWENLLPLIENEFDHFQQ